MNLFTVEQLTLPLITFQVGVPTGHNSHPCCIRAKRDTLIHFMLCHIVKRAAVICVCRYVCVSLNMMKRSLQRDRKATPGLLVRAFCLSLMYDRSSPLLLFHGQSWWSFAFPSAFSSLRFSHIYTHTHNSPLSLHYTLSHT